MSHFIRKPKTELLTSLLKALRQSMNSDTQEKVNSKSERHIPERREFLKNTGKAAAAIGLLGILEGCKKTFETISSEEMKSAVATRNPATAPRIAIIGAGISGLHAAYVLKQKGYMAQVYEGSNRVGGRMFTAKNIMGAGLTTELGGEFIDSGHKDMLKLAGTFNLDLIDTRPINNSGTQYQAYFFNGIHYTELQVINEFSLYSRQIRNDIQSLSGYITADQHTANDLMFDNMSIAAYFDRIGLQGWLRKLLDVAYLTEYGLSIDKQTSLNFLYLISPLVNNNRFDIFGVSDERFKVKGGNQQICDRLAEQLDGQISTDHELTAIKKNSNSTYDLTFKQNNKTKTITCDFLLITIPFTLLRNVAVTPAWPEWKRKAIFDIGYGNNSKLMIGFTSRYWHQLGYAGYYFADNILQSGWDSSELQAPVTGSLTIYSGGNQALNVGNGSINSQVNSHLPIINQMYPGATANYNGKAERFIWPTYKWTKASYTCFLPGQYTTIAGNEMKPVDKIFFAGEHCSYNFQGFMNGGAETGRKAAEEIIKLI